MGRELAALDPCPLIFGKWNLLVLEMLNTGNPWNKGLVFKPDTSVVQSSLGAAVRVRTWQEGVKVAPSLPSTQELPFLSEYYTENPHKVPPDVHVSACVYLHVCLYT